MALVIKGQGIAPVSWALGGARELSLRVNSPVDWQDGRCNRHNEEAGAELLPRILAIISDMPGYGYRWVWGYCENSHAMKGFPRECYTGLSCNEREQPVAVAQQTTTSTACGMTVKSRWWKAICAGVQIASSLAVMTAKSYR